MAQHIAGLTDRSDDIYLTHRPFSQATEVHYFVVSAIERRSDQRIHTGRDTDISARTFLFQLRHAREQHPRLRHQEAPRL